MKSYRIMMAVRLPEMCRLLKSTASIYIRFVPTASHYLKTLLDAILGAGIFLRLPVQVERLPCINELAGLSEDVGEAARETLIIGDN